MDGINYDEIIRQMLNNSPEKPDYSGGEQLQQGLLGSTPASDLVNADSSAENILNSMQAKNQQATQQMANTSQQGLLAGMQAAQGLQAQRQAEMNATAQQAAQQQANRGGLLGGLVNKFFIPVKFGGGRK